MTKQLSMSAHVASTSSAPNAETPVFLGDLEVPFLSMRISETRVLKDLDVDDPTQMFDFAYKLLKRRITDGSLPEQEALEDMVGIDEINFFLMQMRPGYEATAMRMSSIITAATKKSTEEIREATKTQD